jgi:hypothetical protein
MSGAGVRERNAVRSLGGREARLDVDDGRAVDGFDGADAQAIFDDLAHGDRVKAYRIGRSGERVANTPVS